MYPVPLLFDALAANEIVLLFCAVLITDLLTVHSQ